MISVLVMVKEKRKVECKWKKMKIIFKERKK